MTCDQCGKTVVSIRLVAGQWAGVDCGCAPALRMRGSAVNPYGDLTLDHISDESGRKVRVTSSRQLAAAEKRYNFASVVRNMDQNNIDSPPQQREITVGGLYKRKFRGA